MSVPFFLNLFFFFFFQLSCLLVSIIFLVSVSYTIVLLARYSFKHWIKRTLEYDESAFPSEKDVLT